MFVGYKLYHDMEDVLMPLSQGKTVRLEIDVLTGQCFADGTFLESLTIPQEMRSWFVARLFQYNIPTSAIKTANLSVEYQATPVAVKIGGSHNLSLWQRIMKIFGRDFSWDWVKIETTFHCRSVIQTSDHEYFSINGKQAIKPVLPAA